MPQGIAPRGRLVRRFVESHSEWLQTTVSETEARYQAELDRRFRAGAEVEFQGRRLQLVIESGGARRRVREGAEGTLIVQLPEGTGSGLDQPVREVERLRLEATREAVEAWLKRQARLELLRVAPIHLGRLGVEAKSLRLGNNRRAWGTCSGRGIVRVHWRLIEAAPELMEYVVAHEVAHLVVPDHSPRFWETLGRTLPDWRERKLALERWERAAE